MGEMGNLFINLENLMEGNTKGVKIGCYSVALVGLTVAIRRIRPFSRFRKPSDIPNRFVRDRQELTGTVQRIEPRGAVLMVDHKPPISLSSGKGDGLPVKIFGVNVTGNGLSWLQTVVAGNEVKLIPVSKQRDWVECEINLSQQIDKKNYRTVNLGESLVAIGFATTADLPGASLSFPECATYYKKLINAEKYALHKKLGVKYYIKPTKSVLLKFVKFLSNLVPKTPRKNVHTARKEFSVS